MRITFLGAAGTVTGSRFLVEVADRRVLVDCGLFQGLKELRLRNWEPFPVRPDRIDAVVLTHAHIDHSGYLPALVRDGFRGDVWATPATAALCRLLLPDAAYLQEEDARWANKRGSSRHQPALPLYTGQDAADALSLLRTQPVHQPFHPVPELTVEFSPAGHIIGAASVRVDDGTASALFTGDVGGEDDPVMRPPAPPPAADVVVTESTYGDRVHPPQDPADALADVVGRTLDRGGIVLVPAFAVGRTQTLLHLLAQLREDDRIPDVPVFLNSPMAISATELFHDFPSEHRLTAEQCRAMDANVRYVRTADESRDLTPDTSPKVIVSASGMATGGRVLHHLRQLAPDPRATILFTGFQAAGTRGAKLLAGADRIKVFGEHVPVRAEVAQIGGLSAHADARELTAWLGRIPSPPDQAWIVHGEPMAADALRGRLRDDLGWTCHVARQGDTVDVHHVAATGGQLSVAGPPLPGLVATERP